MGIDNGKKVERVEENLVNAWIRFKGGDEYSFESLFNIHYDGLSSYGLKFTTNTYLIEESIQDLFVKMWNNRMTLSIPVDVRAYIFKAFRSVIFRKLQRSSRELVNPLDETRYKFQLEMSPDEEILDKETQEEVRRKIKKALNSLTSRQREAIYLRFYENMSYEEISEIMEIEKGASYKLVYRALDRLKAELGSSVFVVIMTHLTHLISR